jgi:hypothetical protein
LRLEIRSLHVVRCGGLASFPGGLIREA